MVQKKGSPVKLRNRIIAVVMTVLMMVACPLQSMAHAEAANQAGNYLEDVYVAVAKTPDEAAKALEADGWTVLKGVDGKLAEGFRDPETGQSDAFP